MKKANYNHMDRKRIRQFTIGMPVFDRWWPVERRGVVKKLYASSMIIKWNDGKEWRYDRDHLRFVERG